MSDEKKFPLQLFWTGGSEDVGVEPFLACEDVGVSSLHPSM